MAVINLRDVPDELARMVKATAASEGLTLREFVLGVLERDIKRGGWTAPAKAVSLPLDVDMGALRGIVAGKIPASLSEEIPDVPDFGPPEIKFVAELCGHEQHNPEDGEMYRCGLIKHGWKVKHGEWIKL